jgi:hypothetical protein
MSDESGVSKPPQDRRSAQRVALSIVGISIDGSWCSQGRLADISANGARIEGGVPLPAIGARVRVGFFLSVFALAVDAQRFEVEGTVARHTETDGFAIAFTQADEALAKLIDMLVWHSSELSGRSAQGGLDPEDRLDFERGGPQRS